MTEPHASVVRQADRDGSTPSLPWIQRDLNVTANTYTHVLMDEAELDYAGLL